jgi:hypothetical protein
MNPLQQAKQFYKVRRDWLGAGGQPSPHAQARADICLECPHNDASRPLEEAGKHLVARHLLTLKGSLGWHVRDEDRLHLCDRCDCLLAVKVFVPLDVARANTPDWGQLMPPHCWMHNPDLK